MALSRIHWPFLAGLGLLAVAACGRGGARVTETATPYLRCLALDPPKARQAPVGPAKLSLEERRLTIEGLEPPLRLAAFSGPGFGGPPAAAQLEALKAAEAQLILVLGGLGDEQTTADATAAALATLGPPVLVVAGGRDQPERIERAIDSVAGGGERIIDATALRSIDIGSDTLIPVAGASEGRYALGPKHCGHGLDDLKDIAGELGAGGLGRRWLIAWHAPGQSGPRGVARTEAGLDLGSADLAELGRRVGAAGGLFAGPAVQAVRPTADGGGRRVGVDVPAPDLRLVVPRLSGVALERDDGSQVLPGFALLRLAHKGLRLVSVGGQ